MTQSFSQIQGQIAALQREAEKLRAKEIDGVVARIKVAIDQYRLTADQLGFGTGPSRRKVTARSKAGKPDAVRSVKYSDDQGNSWAGFGKRPSWLRDALSAGRSLEEFAAGPLAPSAKSAKARIVKKRKPKAVYRDQAGHTWSGMGPRPRWLREALEAGRTLEEMTA